MIRTGESVAEEALAIYRDGLPKGSLTGWLSVDHLYSVATKQWTLITGIPGSGKSEWLDALLVNLMETDGWSFAIYSPENFPVGLHLTKLAEKVVRKPAGRGPTERMTQAELECAIEYLTDRCFWLDPVQKDHVSLINSALAWQHQAGRKFGIVLDPWNTLEHLRPAKWSETEYISAALTDVTNACRQHDCHIFVVAHPAKMLKDKDGNRGVPTPYDISGSAHWYNKADNIITVHRNQAEMSQDVEIHVQKIRFKHIGKVGMTTLKYDRITGRYHDAPPHMREVM